MSMRSLRRRTIGAHPPETIELGLLVIVVSGIYLWVALLGQTHGQFRAAIPTWPGSPLFIGSFLTYVVGMGLAVGIYARMRNLSLPFGLRGSLISWFVAILVPTLLVVTSTLVANALFETSLGAIAQRSYHPEASLSIVLATVGPLAVFGAIGEGLLLFGAVQGTIRDRIAVRPEHAIGLTVAVAALFRLSQIDLSLVVSSPSLTNFLISAAGFVVLVLTGTCLGLVYQAIVGGTDVTVQQFSSASGLVVALVGLVGFATVLSGFAEFPRAAYDLLWLAVVAFGAFWYERTRSLWVPVLALAVFGAATGLLVYAESVLGLTGPPV